MKESKAECMRNCLQITRGTHVLYRSFGLDPVDDMNIPMMKDVLIQMSTYYPDVTLNDVIINKVESNGQFQYTVDAKGRE